MSANVGRTLLLKKNAVAIVGLNAKTFTFNGESIDITTDDDAGYRTLLSESGVKTIDISFEGVAKDSIVRELTFGDATLLLTDVTLEWPIFNPANSQAATLSCNFRLDSYEETGSSDDKITFTGSLKSSGQWTYTAEAI